MTSTPPPEPPDGDNPLPPRHRPTLGELVKTTTESELWALDDELDDDGPAPDAPPKPQGGAIPSPRERRAAGKNEEPETSESSAKIRMNVGKPRFVAQRDALQAGISSQESDLDDLEMWDEAAVDAAVSDLPEEPVVALKTETRAIEPAPAEASQPTPPAEVDDEFAAPRMREDAKPVSLRPHLRLSGVERIGMLVLAVLLVSVGIYFYVFSVKRLPRESVRTETQDFPLKGAVITIKTADTYWRKPVATGPDADTVRRGTELLPEIVLTVEGRGALRVLFRNDERQYVGDVVTRTVDGADTLRIPATAGFEDAGMHAAYRTGGTKPWTVSVYEGVSADAPGSAFKKLFEMNVSTDRR